MSNAALKLTPEPDLQSEIDRLNRRLDRIKSNMESSLRYYRSYRDDAAARAIQDALELFGDFD